MIGGVGGGGGLLLLVLIIIIVIILHFKRYCTFLLSLSKGNEHLFLTPFVESLSIRLW